MKHIFLSALIVSGSLLGATPSRDFPPVYIKGPKIGMGSASIYTIEMIDGNMFNGEKFANTMKLRTNLNERRLGIKTNQGLVGYYLYNDNKHSLSSLITLEKNAQRAQEMRHFLQEVIVPDFLKLTEPFLVDATGAKPAMMSLIKEWAEKAGRSNSLLLAWGASKEGHESDVVRNQAKTIQEFDQFCADLVYFLESLMRSCKVATQQYKEHLQHLVNQAK